MTGRLAAVAYRPFPLLVLAVTLGCPAHIQFRCKWFRILYSITDSWERLFFIFPLQAVWLEREFCCQDMYGTPLRPWEQKELVLCTCWLGKGTSEWLLLMCKLNNSRGIVVVSTDYDAVNLEPSDDASLLENVWYPAKVDALCFDSPLWGSQLVNRVNCILTSKFLW